MTDDLDYDPALVTWLREQLDDVVEKGQVIHRNAIKPLLLRAKNIETLAVGPAGEALRAALDRVRSARSEIRAVTDTRKVDLSAIDDAIAWFS